MKRIGMDDFYRTYEMLFGNPYLSVLVGIPYFALGRHFAEIWTDAEGRKRIAGSKKKYIFGGILCLVLLMTEVFLCSRYKLAKSTDCHILLLPCIYCMFPLILNWNINIENAGTLRSASTILFFSHFLFLFSCEIMEWLFKITIPSIGKFFFALAASMLTSWIILTLQKKEQFRWLKPLH